MEYDQVIRLVSSSLDVLAMAVIVGGTLASLVNYVFNLLLHRRDDRLAAYQQGRQSLGRAILLGLEIFIAGDIIRTVAIAPTFDNVGVLGLIVLVRTFLSATLQVEIEGHWPWQEGVHKPGRRP